MKPSRAKAVKKRPAKRRDNPLVTKLLNLKYRISDAYHNPNLHKTLVGDTRIDKQWVVQLIADTRTNNVSKLCKEDMLKCNEIWRKYA